MAEISNEISRQDKGARIGAYIKAILQANAHVLEEVVQMSDKATLEQVLERIGFTAEWEARGIAIGEETKALRIAQNMIKLGLPLETIASVTQLEEEKVKALYLST